MAFKLFALFALVACANAGGLIESQPIVQYASDGYGAAYGAHPAPALAVAHAAPALAVAHAAPAVYAAPAVKTLAYAPSAYDAHSYGVSSQNIVRSHGGTVSQISKQVVTPHSSVQKYDTRITNDGYKYGYAAAAPAVLSHSYAPQLAYQAAPIAKIAYSQPAITKTYAQPIAYAQQYAAPAYTKSYAVAQPAVYQQAAPVVYSQPAVTKIAVAQPAVAKIAYAQPALQYAGHSGYGLDASHGLGYSQYATKAVSYSPAAAVAHVNYESPVAHYGW